jgi:dihydroorotase
LGILIRNGTLIDPITRQVDKQSDILISGDRISGVAPSIKPGPKDEVFEAKGMFVTPGLMDMHSHLREPGRADKEKVYTGTRSAAMGGLTAVAAMPNTDPPIDSVVGVKFLQMLAHKEGAVRIYPIAAITKARAGEELTEIGDLVEEGAVAVSDDGQSVMNAELMRRALEYCKMFTIPVIQHSEDSHLAEGGQMNEGSISAVTGLKGIPSSAEEVIIARDILLAKYTGGHLHCAHVSTKGAVELIRRAKNDGVNVTCEVTGHHFSLTEESLRSFDTNFKMNPPLRTAEDVKAVIEGLKDGTIDCIVSDHAPHTIYEKEQEFDYAPFGIIGFETLVPLAFTHLVHTGIMKPVDVIRKFLAPYKILNLKCEGLKEGAEADITVIDPNLEFTYKKEDIVSKSVNTPFIGTKFKGAPVLTIVGGQVVMKDRKILI